MNYNTKKLKSIAEGGEGIIYDCGTQVFKEYKPCVNIPVKIKKAKALASKVLPKEAVAPTEVFDNGYLMEKVDGEEFKRLCNRKFVDVNHVTTQNILQMLVQIQVALEDIHSKGIYIGDLNDQNILFNNGYSINIIDCDSWSVDTNRCDVAMESFQDPMLKGNDFNKDTDTFAFMVLAWKTLTRTHPYGGTMEPDIDTISRMEQGIHIISNKGIKLPRTTKKWDWMHPNMIAEFKAVFEHKSRKGIDFKEVLSNLKQCPDCGEYYHKEFDKCPMCSDIAKIQSKPSFTGTCSGLTLVAVLDALRIATVISENTYLSKRNEVVDIKTSNRMTYTGNKIFFFTDGTAIEDASDYVTFGKYVFEKKHRSDIRIENDTLYFISPQDSLTEVKKMNGGNSIKPLIKCSNNAFYEVFNGHYCVINYYDNASVINCDGYYVKTALPKIVNYGIHRDPINGNWLVITEDGAGKFHTAVVNEGMVYQTDKIRYTCPLSNLCMRNGTIYMPIDGKIRGFNFTKNTFKEWECGVVSEGSKLIRTNKGFTIVNPENIYTLS